MVSESRLQKAKDVRSLVAYKHLIPLGYWREGTIGKLVSKRGEMLLAIADMNGHVIFARDTGNAYYRDRPDEDYINVAFLHKIDQYTIQPGQRPQARTARTGNDRFMCNEGIYLRDGWQLFVDDAAHQDYLRDKRIEDERTGLAKKAAERDDAIKRIEAAEAELAEARKLLGNL